MAVVRSAGGGYIDQPYIMPGVSPLCISDIERLAKAGVKVEIGQITPVQDMTPAPPNPPTSGGAEEAIWDRWRRAKRVGRDNRDHFGVVIPFQLRATCHNEKMWVSVHPASSDYEPFFLQDELAIFPSDALMAQLALWEANHK